MGRPRKPTALKLVDGTYRSDRDPDLDQEPDVTETELVKPAYLKKLKNASKLWDEFAPKLWWLGEVDSPLFARWCVLEAKFRAGRISENASLIEKLLKMQTRLGMDPEGRAKMGMRGGVARRGEGKNGAAQEDPADEHFA